MNMNMNLDRVHDKLLSLLKDFHKVCVENKIDYSLGYGTAIGAVRHHGFIPWDDDADIIMDYDNYCKLTEVLPNDFEIHQNRLWIPRFFKKNSSLDIDILVLCSISNKKFKRMTKVYLLRFLQGTLKSRPTLNKGVLNALFSIITFLSGKLFSYRTKIQLYNLISSSFLNGKSLLFSAYDDFSLIKNIYPKDITSSYSKVKFEDAELMLLDKYDEYLKIIYGDYMKLPPESERVPAHSNISNIELE